MQIEEKYSLQTHFLFDFAESLHSQVNVFLGVACGDLGTDAVLALGHHGVAECHHIHALFQHPLGKRVSHLGSYSITGTMGCSPGSRSKPSFSISERK